METEWCGYCGNMVSAPAFAKGVEHLEGCTRYEKPKRRVLTIGRRKAGK